MVRNYSTDNATLSTFDINGILYSCIDGCGIFIVE